MCGVFSIGWTFRANAGAGFHDVAGIGLDSDGIILYSYRLNYLL
jgi:hypothetical protein